MGGGTPAGKEADMIIREMDLFDGAGDEIENEIAAIMEGGHLAEPGSNDEGR